MTKNQNYNILPVALHYPSIHPLFTNNTSNYIANKFIEKTKSKKLT
jgi:hypothetical protein